MAPAAGVGKHGAVLVSAEGYGWCRDGQRRTGSAGNVIPRGSSIRADLPLHGGRRIPAGGRDKGGILAGDDDLIRRIGGHRRRAAGPETVCRDGRGPQPRCRLLHGTAGRIGSGRTHHPVGGLGRDIVCGGRRPRRALRQNLEAVAQRSKLHALVLDAQSADQQLAGLSRDCGRARVGPVVVPDGGVSSIQRAHAIEGKETGGLLGRRRRREVNGNRATRQSNADRRAEDQGTNAAGVGAIGDVGILGINVACVVGDRHIRSGRIHGDGHEDGFSHADVGGDAERSFRAGGAGHGSDGERGRSCVVQGKGDGASREAIAHHIGGRHPHRIAPVAFRSPRGHGDAAGPGRGVSTGGRVVSRGQIEGARLPGRAGPVQAIRGALQGEGRAVGTQAHAAAVVARSASEAGRHGGAAVGAAASRRRHRRRWRRCIQGEADRARECIADLVRRRRGDRIRALDL